MVFVSASNFKLFAMRYAACGFRFGQGQLFYG